MGQQSESKRKFMVGLFVLVGFVLLFVSLFIIGQSEGTWETKTNIYADFRTITGLAKGSPVQLAGVKIGTVESIDFVNRTYECSPMTEDMGRFGESRTDDCDAYLFCSPDSLCAELEPYASRGMHNPCSTEADCEETEICVSKAFRRRAKRVFWAGPNGVCARYLTEHRRVQVTMRIFQDKLPLIKTDSRATVASNGVLGDQLINITPGMREDLGSDRRLQTTPSLQEDIALFRERIDGLTEKVDGGLMALSSLFSELNDEGTIAAVKGTIENVDAITNQIADGQGVVGGLLKDEEYKKDFGQALRSVRNTAQGVDDFVYRANQSLGKVDENLQPVIDDARKTMADLRKLLEDLKNPSNKSLAAKLLYDEEGNLVQDIERIIADIETFVGSAKTVMARVERGDGSVGKLINDPKAYDALVKVLSDFERNNAFKRISRYIIELDEQKKD